MRLPPPPPHEPVLWQGRPSWMDHAVLSAPVALCLLRAWLSWQAGDLLTSMIYSGGIAFFLTLAAALRYGCFYQITTQRLRIGTGVLAITTRDIPISDIGRITVRYGVFNRLFDIGMLEVFEKTREEASVVLKGIPHPERLQQQMARLAGLRETS